MSECDCKHPELKPEDKPCSPEQIRQCHGDQEHPCKEESEEK